MKNYRPMLAALVALLIAAVTAEFFPNMKSLAILCLLFSAVCLLTGCTTSFASKLAKMPDGKFSKAKFEETDKIGRTTIEMTGVVKENGELAAKTIHFEHANPWITKVSFDAEDYEAQLSKAAQKKPLPAKDTGPAKPLNAEGAEGAEKK